MKDVETAPRKHLFVKKSDGEGDDFYYMGKFKIIEKIKSWEVYGEVTVYD